MNTSTYNSNIKTVVFSDKCFEKHIGCVFRSSSKFSLYPRSQTTSKTPENIENNIINVTQNVLLFHPILRKMLNESNGTYLSLQKVVETAKTSDNHVEFLKISRQYRSILRVCIENFQEASLQEQDGVLKNSLLSYITIFYSIECIWHLCEFLYIDNIPGDIVLPFLLEWVRFHFPCHEKSAAEILENCERGSEDHPEYWDTVIGMIVQGRVDVARALLKLHSAADSNEFKLTDNTLRSMPVYSVYGGLSTNDFTISWKHWQAECRSKLSSGVLASQPKLELILRLITGDYMAFESIRGQYSSWFDILGGWVMFTCPWAKRHELAAAAGACAGMHAPPAASRLDDAVRALLDGDLHQVIHEIQQMADNGWFATHLTDMLHHCGKLTILDKQQNNVTSRLRDSLVLEYGTLLMEHKSLWSVGLSYLASCPPEGLRRAELLLERLPLHTEARAMRVIAEAKKYGLLGVAAYVYEQLIVHNLQYLTYLEPLRELVSHCGHRTPPLAAPGSSLRHRAFSVDAHIHVKRTLIVGGVGVQTVCACESARALRAGRVGGALAWAVRGRGGAQCARAAHAALRRYARTGRLPAEDLLLSAGPSLLITDALLFLGKYCEFHSLYKSKEFKKAAGLLVSLLTSKIAPDYFWETLLLDVIPLLESEEPVFSSSDTYEIMLCLELKNTLLETEKVSLLRLGLVRNLARTALAEGPDGNIGG